MSNKHSNNRVFRFLNTWPGLILGGVIFTVIVIANGVIAGEVTINWPK